MNDTPAIHDALIGVISDIPAIGKDRRVSGSGPTYNYRGIEDILPHVRAAFVARGVHVTPNFVVLTDETYTTKKNAVMRRVVVSGTFTFHAEDGSSVTASTIGEAADSGDKSFNKAMTAAYKYALVETLCLTEVEPEDPDATSSAEAEHAQPGAPPPPRDGMTLKGEAKGMFLAACGGDTDCARAAWDAAALTVIDDHYIATAAVEAALVGVGEESAPPSGEGSDEAGEAPPPDSSSMDPHSSPTP